MTPETVLANPVWPKRWPYGPEDFRPLGIYPPLFSLFYFVNLSHNFCSRLYETDYTRDDVINTGPQYTFSQSLIVTDQATLFPGKKNLNDNL